MELLAKPMKYIPKLTGKRVWRDEIDKTTWHVHMKAESAENENFEINDVAGVARQKPQNRQLFDS